MPLNIADFPAVPECGGTQWAVTNQDQLATLVGTVLVGRAQHAARVLRGVQHVPVQPADALKERLRQQLHPGNDALRWHRDGLLFEIICWIVARMTAGPNDVISDPHLTSTQQGLDTVRLAFDPAVRNVTRAIICEQKCTDNARNTFRDEVLPAFQKWMAGTRDNQLTQLAAGLLSRFNLTDQENTNVYDTLVQDRPLHFQAALTVTPNPFATALCVALFKDYSTVTAALERRLGDTFPLPNIRQWFESFAERVWQKIDGGHV
ncbi:MAG: hypothetical protein ACJ8LM_16675 [Candidatus Udaeobacter sp.]